MPVPLSQILASHHPDLSAHVAVAPAWSRAAFNRAALYLSARLQAERVRTAAFWFDDAAKFACAMLGAWHAGVKVLLPPNQAQENIAWADDAGDIWLGDGQAGAGYLKTFWAVDEVWANIPADFTAPENVVLPLHSEAWLKTSGSGGQAQVVRKTVLQMQEEALALAAVLPFEAAEQPVALGSVSPQHMYGFTFRFAVSLSMGWAIGREQHVYPEHLLAATAKQSDALWIASPAVLNRLGEGRDWDKTAGKIRGILSAGGALPQQTAAQMAQYAGALPFEIYGSTETGVIAGRQHDMLWQALPGVETGINEDGALWAESLWTAGRQQTADVIEACEGGFKLLGRIDRIIKFEDKRVSLTQIEHDLLAHPWVADAYCAVHPQYRRPSVWLALNGTGIEALRSEGRGAVVDALKKHVAAAQDSIAVPRYWRFAEALPRNAQSKITAHDFQVAFTEKCVAPLWPQPEQLGEHNYVYASRVPLDLIYFGGHFAAYPLLPGVTELKWVQQLAAGFAWGQRRIVRVENLKYQQFLRPGDVFCLRLDYDAAKDKLSFKLDAGEAVYASGRIVFAPQEAG